MCVQPRLGAVVTGKKKSGGFLRGRSALLLLELGAVLMVQTGNVQISDAIFFPVELGGISHS